MRRNDTYVGMLRASVIVGAMGLIGSPFVLADEPPAMPTPLTTAQEENATPADSGQVQERAVRQGGGMGLGYDCSSGTECTCTGDVDCNNMFGSGKCTGTIFDRGCDTSKPVPACWCTTSRQQTPQNRFLPKGAGAVQQLAPVGPTPTPRPKNFAPIIKGRGIEREESGASSMDSETKEK